MKVTSTVEASIGMLCHLQGKSLSGDKNLHFNVASEQPPLVILVGKDQDHEELLTNFISVMRVKLRTKKMNMLIYIVCSIGENIHLHLTSIINQQTFIKDASMPGTGPVLESQNL